MEDEINDLKMYELGEADLSEKNGIAKGKNKWQITIMFRQVIIIIIFQ